MTPGTESGWGVTLWKHDPRCRVWEGGNAGDCGHVTLGAGLGRDVIMEIMEVVLTNQAHSKLMKNVVLKVLR